MNDDFYPNPKHVGRHRKPAKLQKSSRRPDGDAGKHRSKRYGKGRGQQFKGMGMGSL